MDMIDVLFMCIMILLIVLLVFAIIAKYNQALTINEEHAKCSHFTSIDRELKIAA